VGVGRWGFPVGLSSRVVIPPAVFGGCPPPVLLSRVVATFLCLMCSLLSGVPAPGRSPGRRHGSVDTKALVPELQQQDQANRCHGLPPRAGSEYDDLRAYGGLLCTQAEDMAHSWPPTVGYGVAA